MLLNSVKEAASASKANSGDVYSKLEIDGITAGKANAGYCQIIYNHDIMGEKYEDPEYGCFRIVDQFGMVHVSLFGYTKEGFEVKQGDTLLTLPQEIAPRYHLRVPVVILTRLGGSLGFACAIHEGNGWMTLYTPNGVPANARGIIGQFWYQLF